MAVINSSNAACNEPAERQFGVRHGLSGHWLSDRHKALLYQQITCFDFQEFGDFLGSLVPQEDWLYLDDALPDPP